MTPAARLSAAIEVLDRILQGQAVEPALTNWGRANRFAGSGDRAAIRDHVFDALRCRRSFATLGGSDSGRGLMLGMLRDAGLDPASLFTGQGHAPAPVMASEAGFAPQGTAALDCPDWLAPALQASLGPDFVPVMQAMRRRAPVFLRVNTVRGDRPTAIAALAAEGIVAQPHDLALTALEVTGNARKIQTSQAYLGGLVELQDASSQAVVQALPLASGQRVLDYCAGGGGKSLAMAARAGLEVQAHDADPGRMRDLPARAGRAGAEVRLVGTPVGQFDLVLADAPCSGSGSWRRDPAGKWALKPERLLALQAVQAAILDRVAGLVAPEGVLAYATCSLLGSENAAQIDAFCARTPGWRLRRTHSFTPLQGGDGFFLALLERKPATA
jgi:16S rRNA (cytosine967-C5)-methyltransferase